MLVVYPTFRERRERNEKGSDEKQRRRNRNIENRVDKKIEGKIARSTLKLIKRILIKQIAESTLNWIYLQIQRSKDF